MPDTLSPQQLATEGQSAYQRGEYQAAATAFQAAAEGLALQGDALAAAEAANNVSVALLQAGDAAGALLAVGQTEAQFAQAGDLRRQGMAAGNRGAALEALGRCDEAIQAYTLSAELLQQAGETDLRAHVLKALSVLQLRKGQRLEAYGSMYAGVRGIQKPNLRQKFLKVLLEIPFKLFNRS